MHSRFTKSLLSLAAVATLALPGVAMARQGSDDPANHVRREHHQRFDNHHRRGADDAVRHARGGRDDGRGGRDDGPNHR